MVRTTGTPEGRKPYQGRWRYAKDLKDLKSERGYMFTDSQLEQAKEEDKLNVLSDGTYYFRERLPDKGGKFKKEVIDFNTGERKVLPYYEVDKLIKEGKVGRTNRIPGGGYYIKQNPKIPKSELKKRWRYR